MVYRISNVEKVKYTSDCNIIQMKLISTSDNSAYKCIEIPIFFKQDTPEIILSEFNHYLRIKLLNENRFKHIIKLFNIAKPRWLNITF